MFKILFEINMELVYLRALGNKLNDLLPKYMSGVVPNAIFDGSDNITEIYWY